MSPRRQDHEPGSGRGLGGFLRSLLAGIPWSERAEGRQKRRFPAPPGGVLRIDNANGRTRVMGEDRRDVEVGICKSARAESVEQAERLVRAIRLLAREDGAGELELEVEIPGRWNRRGRADLDERVPRELAVQVSASNGRLRIEGLRGAVRARSANGAVRIVDVIGDVEVHTSNAKVHGQQTCGRMLARSSNGKIELEEHRGSVDAATSNGTIPCKLVEMGKEGAVLATSNGRISLELPAEADADVDIRVDNGLIRCTRSLSSQSRERSGRLKGALGRGGVPIRLRASNGTISLH